MCQVSNRIKNVNARVMGDFIKPMLRVFAMTWRKGSWLLEALPPLQQTSESQLHERRLAWIERARHVAAVNILTYPSIAVCFFPSFRLLQYYIVLLVTGDARLQLLA